MTTFYIEQFGCRATQADGAALERQLLERGCTSARNAPDADIVVVNTCTVTASADAQARDAIRKLRAANPHVRVIVTGCYAQRAPEELSRFPGVAWVVGNSHKPQIPDLIETISLQTGPPPSNDFFPLSAISPASQPEIKQSAEILLGDVFAQQTLLSSPVFGGEGNHTRPTLKIQDGCNSRCSFCVIPFVRGKSRSLPPDQVLAEIDRLTAGQTFLPVLEEMADQRDRLDPGNDAARREESLHSYTAREIVLSGINLGTYGRDLSPRVEFIDLLRRILDE